MALVPQKPKRVSAGIVTIILSLLSMVLITVWLLEGQGGLLHGIRTGSLALTAPLQHVGSFIRLPFSAAGSTVNNITASPESLEELQARNEELTVMVMRLEEYRLENERLTRLLELVDAYSLDACGARVISHTTDSWNRTITIDKGFLDGLTVGMPVLSADGLIGQLETVGPISSTVRLITDSRSGVAVFLAASRTEGILTGSEEGLLYLSMVPLSAIVVPGDVVITSGAGGVYPKGIVIGEVVSVTQEPTDLYKVIIVAPIKRTDYYEEVVVLISRQSEVAWNGIATSNSGGNHAANSGGNHAAGSGDSSTASSSTRDGQHKPTGRNNRPTVELQEGG